MGRTRIDSFLRFLDTMGFFLSLMLTLINYLLDELTSLPQLLAAPILAHTDPNF